MTSVRQRPTLWSYLSFQKNVTRHDRSSSISAQRRPDDPYEKPDRFTDKPTTAMSNRWVKTVVIVAIFCVALFFFGPQDSISKTESYIQGVQTHAPISSKQGQVAADSASGTTKCLRSSSKHKPIVQYAIMVDAGSTGSRIHVYRFNNCGETPELENEDFKMINPGLSSFKEDAEGAAKSLDQLLEVAMKSIPKKLRSCTPIAVKATAGLRLLGDELSKNILNAVKTRLETKYPFPIAKDGVIIMDGKDEGVYAWITTNYLLGKIGSVEKIPTAAIFDLGGGSTQIVFQPTFPTIGGGMPETLKEGDHKYFLNFGGRSFDLYQHSHLGLGLMEARKSIHKVLAKTKMAELGAGWEKYPIINPCINVGQSRLVEVDIDGTILKLNMTGPTDPAPAQCRALAETILNKGVDCKLTPCSFNGVHQPSLERTFAKEDVFIFSYFYDRVKPLGMPDSFTLREMMDTTAKVCGGEESWGVFSGFDKALEELRDRPEYCLDLSFMVALLHTGYEMPMDREVKTAKKIKGNELGWCLGASLPLLDSTTGGWQCKLKEVS
ncbi:Similar to Probable guanosine-diphosphatase; acc. no. Q8TGG8 [Pyronema omphalodes CBS 100304]|uniref:guanosine-diphosphatase n=1 Tax=Pyronema omphalodes (strain CBS 100304) TaxID=1076935 RepID=U4LCB8_PYROM|nr:Similar to Probable guanosine-diphosphatase; acc. no. Q8TGG8 [Pyronema omphalodes CBS 100304]